MALKLFPGKRGMFFTLMTVTFLVLFLLVFLLPTQRKLEPRFLGQENRIQSMNNFIKDVDRDTQRGLYIASYRAILAIDNHIIQTGNFVADPQELILEAIVNGTLYGVTSDLMNASTFSLWMAKIGLEAENFNLNSTISINEVKVFQVDPWFVTIEANISLVLSDLADTAEWNRTIAINTSIPITEFEDPLYIVGSAGRTTNNFNRTPHQNNFTFLDGEYNVSNLLDHATEGFYIENPNAPSFLGRFQNNLTASPYGIESLVDLNKLSSLGLSIDDTTSIVDYHYWNTTGNADYRVNFTPNWFVIDDDHVSFYMLDNITYAE